MIKLIDKGILIEKTFGEISKIKGYEVSNILMYDFDLVAENKNFDIAKGRRESTCDALKMIDGKPIFIEAKDYTKPIKFIDENKKDKTREEYLEIQSKKINMKKKIEGSIKIWNKLLIDNDIEEIEANDFILCVNQYDLNLESTSYEEYLYLITLATEISMFNEILEEHLEEELERNEKLIITNPKKLIKYVK